MSMQANSNVSVPCDQCFKAAPAQYHLTMSDASVRNFCGYNCVMAFQAQFAQPSINSGGGGPQQQQQQQVVQQQQPVMVIPGNQVTPNAVNAACGGEPGVSAAVTRVSARAAARRE